MRRGDVILGLVVVLCLQGQPPGVVGQENEVVATYFVGPIVGMVVDPAGEPAAGAKVWLIGGKHDEDPPKVLQETATDSSGRFRIDQHEYELFRDDPRSPTALVRDAAGHIGGTSRIGLHAKAADPQEVRIKLVDVKEYHGRLEDASGQPIKGARIKLTAWTGGTFDEPTREYFELSSVVIKPSTVTTAEDGSFVLRGVPVDGVLRARITTEEYGSPNVTFSLAKQVTIRINRPGRIRGTVVAEGTPGDAAEVTLYLTGARERIRPQGVDYRVYYGAEGKSDDSGSFYFDAVPAGKYVVYPRLGQDSPYVSQETSAFEVKPGEEVVVSVPLKRAIAIHGKVVDKKTGKGLQGVRVLLRNAKPTPWSGSTKAATTDEQGAYTVAVKPGSIRMEVSQVPEGYVKPGRGGEQSSVEVTKDMTWPTIELQPTAVIEGIVVDESGKPVPNAEVRPLTKDGNFYDHDPVKTDQTGRFVLKKGTPTEPLQLRVRSETAASDGPVVIVPKDAESPARFVISEKTAFSLRGRLVDDSGLPIRGAQLGLRTDWRVPGGAIGFQLSTGATEDTGHFEFLGLWPGDEYTVHVEAEGFDKYETAEVKGTAGKTHDFGSIVLVGASGFVEGRIVDSAGNPVAGVQVFNAGDAPQPLATTSDAKGGFRLEGLRTGPVYVFAKHEGYRFTSVRTQSGDNSVQLKLLTKDEPVPARPRADYPSFEEQQQIARTVLERLWRFGDQGRTSTVIASMARLDVEKAMEWSRQMGGRYDRTVRRIAAERIAQTDVEEAKALLVEDGTNSYLQLKRLADRLAASDPAKAMRLTEELTIQARAADQPGRTIFLARTGALIARLGNEQAGRGLIEEAVTMLDKMGSQNSRSRACGGVARAIAPFDLDRALKMLETVTDEDAGKRALVDVAIAAVPQDLAKTQKLLGDMEGWHASSAFVPMAYHLALKRPDDALHFIEEYYERQTQSGDRWANKAKAQALGWVAVAIAAGDQPRAWALIDQGLDPFVRPNIRRGYIASGNYGGQVSQAATLAVLASQVDYPDMDSVIHRVLASRLTTKDEYSPTRVVESNVAMAMLLALVDPETAREVLASVEPYRKAIGSGGSGLGQREFLIAWALADPRQVLVRVERELAAAENKPDWDMSRSGLLNMAEILTVPPPERLKHLSQHLGRFWTPGQEG